MTKKIAVINDLSGLGRCSLVAAISVISAMGVQPCPFPTAILSCQTGYPSFYLDDYTEKMEYFRAEWEKRKIEFDGIYTGFVSGEAQIEQIFRFLDTFSGKNNFLLVDPVLGDEGKEYAVFSPGLLKEMHRLVRQADIVTPNLTELCLLTGESYKSLQGIAEPNLRMKKIEELGRRLLSLGPKRVLITGIRFSDIKEGVSKIGNMLVSKNSCKISAFPYIGGSFSGTGDLFASVIAGGAARGDSLENTMELAGDFIERAMKDSVRQKIERNDGVNYEKYLGMLV